MRQYRIIGIYKLQHPFDTILIFQGGPANAIAKQWTGNPIILLNYIFEKPERETYHQEYLVVDTFTLVGAVGGNLGIFVGFEFFGFFCLLLDLFRNLLGMIIFRGLFNIHT